MCSSLLKTKKSNFWKANDKWTKKIMALIFDFNPKQQLKFKFVHKYSSCEYSSCNVFPNINLQINEKILLH